MSKIKLGAIYYTNPELGSHSTFYVVPSAVEDNPFQTHDHRVKAYVVQKGFEFWYSMKIFNKYFREFVDEG